MDKKSELALLKRRNAPQPEATTATAAATLPPPAAAAAGTTVKVRLTEPASAFPAASVARTSKA
jgi:hypothetical protein